METLNNTSATLSSFVGNKDKCRETNQNLWLMLRGWVSSPMAEYEDGGQERLDKFDTLHSIRQLIDVASVGNEADLETAKTDMVTLEDAQSARDNLRCIFQGFIGSPLTNELDPGQRANVVDTYSELEQLIKELH